MINAFTRQNLCPLANPTTSAWQNVKDQSVWAAKNTQIGALCLKNNLMILQLDPCLPLVTVKGKGFAHFLIDYGQEHDLIWVVFLKDSGECWCVQNKDVRMEKNFTMGTSRDTWSSAKTD